MEYINDIIVSNQENEESWYLILLYYYNIIMNLTKNQSLSYAVVLEIFMTEKNLDYCLKSSVIFWQNIFTLAIKW